MKSDFRLVRKVAKIARLDLSEKEVYKFSKDFKDILGYFSQLDKVSTIKVEPTFQPLPIKDVLRNDRVERCLSRKEALSNTKNKEGGYFKGPRSV